MTVETSKLGNSLDYVPFLSRAKHLVVCHNAEMEDVHFIDEKHPEMLQNLSEIHTYHVMFQYSLNGRRKYIHNCVVVVVIFTMLVEKKIHSHELGPSPPHSQTHSREDKHVNVFFLKAEFSTC